MYIPKKGHKFTALFTATGRPHRMGVMTYVGQDMFHRSRLPDTVRIMASCGPQLTYLTNNGEEKEEELGCFWFPADEWTFKKAE